MMAVKSLRRAFALLALAPIGLVACGEMLTQRTTSVHATPSEVLHPEPPKAEAQPEAVARPATAAHPTETAGARATEDATAAPTAATPKDLSGAATEPAKAERTQDEPEPKPEAKAEPKAAGPAEAITLVPMTFDEYRARAATAPEAKLTVVDAWATWCGPCKENFPHLVALFRKYGGRGLNVVSLSMDDPTDPKAVAEATRFLREQGATFTNVLLREDFGVGFERLDINGIPAVFLYGPSGQEIRRFTGDDPEHQFTYEQVDQVVAALLTGEALPPGAPGEVRASRAAK